MLIVWFSALPLWSADRPNILFIYTDDQGAWTLGHAGNRQAHTPVIDRLCREGAFFRNAFVTTPVCSPSRAGLMTSRYGTEVGITDYIGSRETELGLDSQWITWPEVLAAAGYTGGLFGKWHLGERPSCHPTKFGFAEFYGMLAGGASPRDAVLEVRGQPTKVPGLLTDRLTDAALDFIRRHQATPFFACVHYRAPHAPYLPVSEEDWKPFAKLDPQLPEPDYPDLDVPYVKRVMREYLASIAGIDRNIGRLLAQLDELQLTDKTAVIFTSDHGYNVGHHGLRYKGNGYWMLESNRATRSNMFDTSLRVPLSVRWPAAVPAGTVIDQTVTNLDWYPTLVAIAGANLPQDKTIRGRNFLPLLEGQQIPWENDLFGQYSQHHDAHTHMRMFRTPEWKLVRDFHKPGQDELYHLADDPGETRNLIGSDDPGVREVISQLSAKLRVKMHELDDPALEPNE